MIPTAFAPLVTHLWQSTVFAAAAGLLTLALRRNQARVRYWLWLAASYKFLIPFSWLVSIGHQFEWRTAPAIVPSIMPLGFSAVTDAVSGPAFLTALPAAKPAPDHLPALLVAIWACGFVVVAYGWVREWWRIRAMVRAASPLRMNKLNASSPGCHSEERSDEESLILLSPTRGEILRFAQNDNEKQKGLRIVSTDARLEPGVFGIFRPVLLLPEGIADRLTQAQLQAIIAHESCHVRRRDNLTAAIHMLVEALFWFYPLVWWMGARLIDERERACDEEVLQAGSQAQVYAESILKVCEFYLESPLSCISGVTGSDLKKRIQRIMKEHFGVALSTRKKLLLVSAAVVALTVPLLAGVLTAPLRAQSAGGQDPQVKVGTITFQGNTVYSNRQLIRAMRDLRPYAIPMYLFNIPVMSKAFDRHKLDEDLEAGIRAIYQDSGYFNVVVKNPILTTVNGGKTTNIMIAIEEGAQYRMGRLVIRSADPGKPLPAKPETLQAIFTLKGGDIFDAEKVHQAMVGYTKLYSQSVTPHTDANEVAKTIDLTLDFGSASQATRGTASGTGSITPAVAGNSFLQQRAQAPAVQSPPADDKRPAFEVVSIKVNKSGNGRHSLNPNLPGGRMRAVNVSLAGFMTAAYQIPGNRIIGAPNWFDSEFFDIDATSKSESNFDENRGRLQSLLADRFKLAVHRETRQLPVYALVLVKPGKLGPQLQLSDGNCSSFHPTDLSKPNAASSSSSTPSSINCGDTSGSGNGNSGKMRYLGHSVGMDKLLETLTGSPSNPNVDRPIVDRTGLSGAIDFMLEFTPLQLAPSSSGSSADPSIVAINLHSSAGTAWAQTRTTNGTGGCAGH